MANDDLLIQPPPGPEKTQLAQHPNEQRRANIAIVVSLGALLASGAAAGFAGWQVWEAHQARLDARKASEAQARDVERSRLAAERSASAAEAMVQSMLDERQTR